MYEDKDTNIQMQEMWTQVDSPQAADPVALWRVQKPVLATKRQRSHVGQTFNRLTVISDFPQRAPLRRMFLTQCKCGNFKVMEATQVKTGYTVSCGCRLAEIRGGASRREAKSQCSVEGCDMGRKGWIVKGFCRRHAHALRTWGNPVLAVDRGHRRDSHEQTDTPEYAAWSSMKDRCLNPNHEFYHRYGGRGIGFCARFKTARDFLSDLGKRPTAAHSLDRIDNDGGYWCGNCQECIAAGRIRNVRWATQIEQCNNTSVNVMVTYNNETMTIAQWARKIDVPAPTLYWRKNNGRTDEQIITGCR